MEMILYKIILSTPLFLSLSCFDDWSLNSFKTAWYTICLLRYFTIADNNPSIHWPSILLQSVYSNQCYKYPYLSDVLHYTWHLLHFCPSWERDPSHVALWGFYVLFTLLKGFFSTFTLLLLRVKDRGCHTLLKPYETNCDLWIWAIQIQFVCLFVCTRQAK